MDEAGLFEAIAEAAPTAKFKACTTGFTTGQRDEFTAELKKGKLKLVYSCLPDDYEISDDADDEADEAWFSEKSTYDPIKREYKRKVTEEDFVHAMMNKMPLAEFKSLFELSDEKIEDSEYYDFIFDCYGAYCFPDLDFFIFRNCFPNAKIEESEFENKVATAIEKFGLISYEKFCK